MMNQEQFGKFWPQLIKPLQAKWSAITAGDLELIKGDLGTFSEVLQHRYGELHQEEVQIWTRRRYAHWSGDYIGYPDLDPKA